jgi:SAM-dependent methyltransferase
MFPDLLPHLRCPSCLGALTLEHAREGRDGEIVAGALRCAAHRARFPISGGVLDTLGWRLPESPAQLVNNLPPAAWAYERLWRPYALSLLSGEPFGYGRELPLLAQLMAPARPGLYLDVACSNGLYARAIARARAGAPGAVAGIDHAAPMLREARRYALAAGLRISFVRARAQALPFAAGVAGGYAMGGSLNEIGDARACLRELRRVLAHDGRAVLMSLVRATTPAGRALQLALGSGGLQFPTPEEHNHMLREAGLRLVGQWRYRVVLFSQILQIGR